MSALLPAANQHRIASSATAESFEAAAWLLSTTARKCIAGQALSSLFRLWLPGQPAKRGCTQVQPYHCKAIQAMVPACFSSLPAALCVEILSKLEQGERWEAAAATASCWQRRGVGSGWRQQPAQRCRLPLVPRPLAPCTTHPPPPAAAGLQVPHRCPGVQALEASGA